MGQETLVTEDLSRVSALKQSLSVPGINNSTGKPVLMQQLQAANVTLGTDQTKLKTLKTNAVVAQQAVKDAEKALGAARAKADGKSSVSKRELKARDSVRDAESELAVVEARAEAAKKSAGENEQAKAEVMKLVDRNVAQAADRVKGAQAKVEAVKRRLELAKEAHDEATIAKQQRAEEIKSERVQDAAKLAAQQEAERGGSPKRLPKQQQELQRYRRQKC